MKARPLLERKIACLRELMDLGGNCSALNAILWGRQVGEFSSYKVYSLSWECHTKCLCWSQKYEIGILEVVIYWGTNK